MAPLQLVGTPPNSKRLVPSRSLLFAFGSILFKWAPLALGCFFVGAIVLGSESWPYQDLSGILGWGGERLKLDGEGETLLVEGESSMIGPALSSYSSSSHPPSPAGVFGEDISTTPYSLSDPSLDYRRELEITTSPPGYLTHSSTFGFSSIYVLTLPYRTDRRVTMRKLASALGITVTFVEAVPKEASVIGWISERAAEIRRLKRKAMAEYLGIEESAIGGLGVGSVWLTRSHGGKGNQPLLRDIEFPSLAKPEYGGKDWLAYLWEHGGPVGARLEPSQADFNVTEAMWDSLEKIPERQVSPATVSTAYNHLRVLRLMQERGDESALVLEDDVDLEWDVERRWRAMQRRLPNNWETVFLGHCWGKEIFEPQYHHPNLHRSTAPLCLHGYGVSQRGCRHLLSLLSDPWLTFQTPIDTAIPTFISIGLKSFSVEPPVIIQAKHDLSDIQAGRGSPWKGLLADSTLERVWKAEGKDVDQMEKEGNVDPATIFRFRKAALGVVKPHYSSGDSNGAKGQRRRAASHLRRAR